MLITNNTDFHSVFSEIGDSLSRKETVFFHKLGEFCTEVFGVDEVKTAEGRTASESSFDNGIGMQSIFLSAVPDGKAIVEHLSETTPQSSEMFRRLSDAAYARQYDDAAEIDAVADEPTSLPEILPVGAVVKHAEYSGKELPSRYTMDMLSLGDLSTVTPVKGYVNSGFGYREHPIKGEYLFHGGVDISGNTGDPIGSFADGTVQYIGEDDSYGLYLQVDHGNGIKSFYAHCSKILVKKGQKVTAGETIAKVGSSGAATGPHLHMELRCGGYRVDPKYYITTLS